VSGAPLVANGRNPPPKHFWEYVFATSLVPPGMHFGASTWLLLPDSVTDPGAITFLPAESVMWYTLRAKEEEYHSKRQSNVILQLH